MSKPALADPLAAAQRVKDIARDLASDVAVGYRKSSRFLRLRAAIAGTWVLLSLVAVYTSCPGSGPSNELGAEVTLLPETIVGQQLSILNGSPDMWKDVTLTLDDAWRYRVPTIRAGQNLVVGVARFQRDGAQAGNELKPRKIVIECDRGSAEIPLARR